MTRAVRSICRRGPLHPQVSPDEKQSGRDLSYRLKTQFGAFLPGWAIRSRLCRKSGGD